MRIIELVINSDESSMIKSIHYLKDDKNSVLGITFSNDSGYIYRNVKLETVFSLMKAESLGHFFSKNIKGVYPYRDIGNCKNISPLQKAGFC